MLSDEALRARREDAPRWDELREQRVLGRILETRRRGTVRRRRALVAAGVLVLAAVAVVALRPSGRVVAPDGNVAANTPAAAGAPDAPSRIELVDGSTAILSSGASVEIREQSPHRIVVDHVEGEVVYDVRRDPLRDFVVHHGDVRVSVLGTRFRVALDGGWVRVRVERGRVRVDDGSRSVYLGVGEELRVSAVRSRTPLAQARSPHDGARKGVAEVVAAAPAETGSSGESVADEVDALLQRADAARTQGRLGEAASFLETIVSTHPGDPRVPSALFTLGRVERARGRHVAAGAAFERCRERSPRGPLAEDALAEQAASRAASGDRARARDLARAYLGAFPDGTHAERMQRLVE